jgi:hypothetical protein
LEKYGIREICEKYIDLGQKNTPRNYGSKFSTATSEGGLKIPAQVNALCHTVPIKE